ncbi:MAG: Coenzyme F420 hydrogenase/dehydrogenase, beta subunit C-terminal domain [Chloroflexota bacterium]
MTKRLETEVWPLNDCAGCGLCVAACSKQVLFWDSNDHPSRKTITKTVGYTKVPLDSCTFCDELCAEVCPRLVQWSPIEAQLVVAARARRPHQSGAPNDVIHSILASGFVSGLLDGVITLDVEPWSLKPIARVAGSVEEIMSCIGPQYLWAPVLDVLNEAIYVRRMENLAIVGTPCTAQAIRRLRETANPRLKYYREAVALSISVFCTGMYLPEFIDELLIQQSGISPEHVRRVEISKDDQWLQVILWDGTERLISRQAAEPYTRAGCASCTDYLGESADLAVGQLGAPDDASTLLIRTRTGDVFVRNAIRMNLLETGDDVDYEVLQAAAHEKESRDRAQVLKKTQVLMLDALADPGKRQEAIEQFNRLYRQPARPKKEQMVLDGCTGC